MLIFYNITVLLYFWSNKHNLGETSFKNIKTFTLFNHSVYCTLFYGGSYNKIIQGECEEEKNDKMFIVCELCLYNSKSKQRSF